MTNENDPCECIVSLLSTVSPEISPEEKEQSQIHLSASPVIEEEEPCCLCLEELFVEKKFVSPDL